MSIYALSPQLYHGFLTSEIVFWVFSNTGLYIASAIKRLLNTANIYVHSKQLAVKLNFVNTIVPLANNINTWNSCLFKVYQCLLSVTSRYNFTPFKSVFGTLSSPQDDWVTWVWENHQWQSVKTPETGKGGRLCGSRSLVLTRMLFKEFTTIQGKDS